MWSRRKLTSGQLPDRPDELVKGMVLNQLDSTLGVNRVRGLQIPFARLMEIDVQVTGDLAQTCSLIVTTFNPLQISSKFPKAMLES